MVRTVSSFAIIQDLDAGVIPLSVCDLSILIVNYNTAHLFPALFDSIRVAAQGLSIQIVVVDNASRDDSVQQLRELYPEVELIASPHNVGFGRGNNIALPFLRSSNILLLNTDAFVSSDTFKKSLAYLHTNPDIGVLGVHLVGRDGMSQPSCRFFPTPWNNFLTGTGLGRWFPFVRAVDGEGFAPPTSRDCDWVPGCYYLTRREVIDSCGLFDARFFLYSEEVDHCKAVKAAGWRVIYFADTRVVHLGGESAKSDGSLSAAGHQLSDLQVESELLYFRKHHGLAGLLSYVLLAMLEAVVLIGKALVKAFFGRQGLKSISQPWHDLRLRWNKCCATRLGRVALR